MNARFIATLLFTVSLLGIANAAPKLGAPLEGGLFLFEQPIERYKNIWIAFPLMDREKLPTSGQAELQIKGEGKTVDFDGSLSINCGTGKYFWKNASDFGKVLIRPEDISQVVPTQALRNASQLFCREASSQRKAQTNWVRVTSDSVGIEYYVDNSSLSRTTRGGAEWWQKSVLPSGLAAQRRYSYSLEHFQAECPSGSMFLVARADYDSKGTAIRSSQARVPVPTPPESVTATVREGICEALSDLKR